MSVSSILSPHDFDPIATAMALQAASCNMRFSSNSNKTRAGSAPVVPILKRNVLPLHDATTHIHTQSNHHIHSASHTFVKPTVISSFYENRKLSRKREPRQHRMRATINLPVFSGVVDSLAQKDIDTVATVSETSLIEQSQFQLHQHEVEAGQTFTSAHIFVQPNGKSIGNVDIYRQSYSGLSTSRHVPDDDDSDMSTCTNISNL